MMERYKFSDLDDEQLKYLLSLQRVYKPTTLFNDWVNKATLCELRIEEKKLLNKHSFKLLKHVDHWNEQELQLKFIALILELVDFDVDEHNITAFSERTLSKDVANANLHGRVDWMVATGFRTPKQPFFFIHEYKKSLESTGDPVGQLLSTMYVAQTLNSEPKKPTLFEPQPVSYIDLPIYGCYVVGRHWYFVVLKDKDYYISKSYDATDEEKLYKIVKLLKAQKQMIIERVTQNQ